MSQFRRHVVVTIDGEKFDVTTCALDNKGVDIQHADAVDALRPVYNALVRCHVEGIPSSFHQFCLTVDALEDLEGDGESDDADPTRPAPSDG